MNPFSVVNALVTNLSAASAVGSGRVGKDYSIIETSQYPVSVVGWLHTRSLPATFGGGGRDKYWTFVVETFIKDTGSSSAIMDYFLTMSNSIMDSIENDPTLQGTVDQINEIRASRELGEAFLTGGATLYPFVVELDVYEL